MIARRDVAIIYVDQDVSRRNAGNAGGPSGMDILKNPALAVRCVVGERMSNETRCQST